MIFMMKPQMNASLNLHLKGIAYQCRQQEMTRETQMHQQQHQYHRLGV